MTRRPSKLRRILKWVGLAGCVLIVVMWGASLIWVVKLLHYHFAAFLSPGYIVLTYRTPLDNPESRVFPVPGVFQVQRLTTTGFYPSSSTAWKLGLKWPHVSIGSAGGVYNRDVGLPTWLVLIVIAVPTALLWRRDRRPPPGHCQTCGYNLTGLPEPRCPECGEPT